MTPATAASTLGAPGICACLILCRDRFAFVGGPTLMQRPPVRTRKMRIIAQDPSVKVGGKILTTQVEIPAEDLQPGPWGCRVQVIDYDASTGTLLKPLEDKPGKDGGFVDVFEKAPDR